MISPAAARAPLGRGAFRLYDASGGIVQTYDRFAVSADLQYHNPLFSAMRVFLFISTPPAPR